MTVNNFLLVKIVPCNAIYKNYYLASNLIAITLLLSVLFFANFSMVVVAALVFNLLSIGFRSLFQNSRDPFVLFFLTYSLIFIEFPIASMAIRYPMFFPANGLSFDWPAPAEETIVFALGFLFLFYLGFFAAVTLISIKSIDTTALPESWELPKILPVAFVFLAFSIVYDNFLSSQTTLIMPGFFVELTQFLCNEIAIFILIFLIINNNKTFTTNRNLLKGNFYVVTAITSIGLLTFNGSKGALLFVFLAAFIYPLSVLGGKTASHILVPRLLTLLILALFAPILFLAGQAFRNWRYSKPDVIDWSNNETT